MRISLLFFFFFAVILCSFLPRVKCQTPNLSSVIAEVIYDRLSNLSTVFKKEIKDNLGFCINNVEADWNGAFDFSSNLDFLSNCIDKTADLTQRICTAAEIKFYFGSFFGGGSKSTMELNQNCNLTSWKSGCEPGWACSVASSEKVDLENSKNIPARTLDCQACCEGFFCPRGITCMIPCPLGAYCPLAKLNKVTGLCDPYSYQVPPGQPSHTCGGADMWSDIRSSREVFCSAGSYCPTTTEETSCSSGHYCRTGSTSEKKCFKLASCNPNTSNQNIHAYGILLLVSSLIFISSFAFSSFLMA
ncbi:hypothetical protein IFM89_020765 [Coptis chinensis]|uniref:Uncharacterized protein n=1 Tax=Coptis chinensis TaxID=261450 RepID=A0A835HC43_9MAGN|nr:hypothetical protein IFM89_020765 [Coptis chinensis]